MHVPKHAIIAWMAVLDRLLTNDRLVRMGMEVVDKCWLCGGHSETRNHNFSECGFSRGIWRAILRLCCVTREVTDWDGELGWAVRMLNGKSLIVIILKLAWSAFVYSMWLERNARLFRGRNKSVDKLIFSVKEIVRIKLRGMIWFSITVGLMLCNYFFLVKTRAASWFKACASDSTCSLDDLIMVPSIAYRTGRFSRRPRIDLSWEALPLGFLKMNIDGAMLSNETNGGIGGIVRNSFGKCLGTFSLPVGSGPPLWQN
ncbi:hypothetical protein GQ457_01G028970 [Hibiscus cannabinus]